MHATRFYIFHSFRRERKVLPLSVAREKMGKVAAYYPLKNSKEREKKYKFNPGRNFLNSHGTSHQILYESRR